MAYCRNCGAEMNESDKFCAACGKAVNEGSRSSAAHTAEKKFKELNNTEDFTSEYSEDDIEANKIIALFAYLNLLILIPVFAGKESKFARFHVSQGVNLIIADVAFSAIAAVLGAVFAWLPVLDAIIGVAVSIAGVALTVIAVIGIYNAVTGKAKELPIIGSWKIVNY